MKILAFIYSVIINIKNYLYNNSILKINKIDDVNIICIGNIVVGGAGKTPAVHYYAKKCIKDGKKVGILSRGYKGKRDKDPFLVRDYENIKCTFKECGDEPYLHALKFNIPVVVSKDRYYGAKMLKEKYNVDTIIMDDGYQHRKLYRNKNILLIDATNPFGNYKYLPLGKLRESLTEIKRADEIIISKSNYVDEKDINNILIELNKYNVNNVPIHLATFNMKGFYNFDNKKLNLNEIKNKNILIFSSIANPEVFYNTIKKLNPKNIDTIYFEDHHHYNNKEIENIFNKSNNYDYVITTEKDMVKINRNIKKLYFLEMEFCKLDWK